MPGNICLNLKLEDFKNEGLYLIFEDSTIIDLSKENIDKITEEYWKKSQIIFPSLEKKDAFVKDPICSIRKSGNFCDAIRPMIAFLGQLDKYSSYDKVTAVYKGKQENAHTISYCTMQQALKYVSILCSLYYCQVGRTYWKYYWGINPLMDGRAIAERAYLNIYFLNDGEKSVIESTIKRFKEEMRITNNFILNKIRLIVKNDSMINAIVSALIVTDFLEMNIDRGLKEAVSDPNKILL